ncbi:MAG TPA: class I SAM-dependent methyltransferase [Anaerolineae bacterium]|nr:class I SAM-dependent methyltransferase [Anaerolineae bacterium]
MNQQMYEPPAAPALEVLDQITAHIHQVGIFRAALELQVWAKVAAGEDTAEAIASAHHWDPMATRLLLDDLCAMNLLAHEGNQYHLVPEAEQYLLPDKPTYMGRYLQSEFAWEGNGELAEAIQTGKRPIGYRATTTEMKDTWIGMYAGNLAMPQTYLAKADKMWQEVGIEPRAGLEVLDLACGPAPRSFALARAHPGVRATLLDWEQILAVAGKVAAELGIGTQVTLLPGDLWSVPHPSQQYDVVFLGDITHFFSPEQNIRLFCTAREALVEGGTLVVNAVRRENPNPLAPGLWYFAISDGGATWDFHEYEHMLQRAGFSDIVDVNKRPIKATKRS